MKGKIRVSAVVSLLIPTLGTGLIGCSNDNQVQFASPETVRDVPVAVARHTIVPDWLEAVGTVRAAQTSQVASQTMGNIVEIKVREGDRVQSGQVLAVIDDSQPRAAVEQAAASVTAAQKEVSATESELTLAEVTLKRFQQLYEKKSVSPQEYDEVKARFQSAEARRDMARAGQAQASATLTHARISLGYTRIRAPFAGVVTERKADTGTLASPAMPLFTIEDTGRYRLEATVDESDVRLVRTGQAVPVFLDALRNNELPGRVAQIVPAADPASHSFLVKVELPADQALRSGLFGRTRFSRGERSVLLIPQTAMVQRGQLQGTYAIDANGIAVLRYVALGRITGQQVEVLSGLQDGERLIAAPGGREWSGKRIEARQ